MRGDIYVDKKDLIHMNEGLKRFFTELDTFMKYDLCQNFDGEYKRGRIGKWKD